MKVLMVVGSISKLGGTEKFCRLLSKSLEKKNIRVEIATQTKIENYNGLKLHNLPIIKNKYLRKSIFDYYNPLVISRIEEILDETNIDIIHFNNLYGIGSYSVKYFSNRCKTVVTIHDLWPVRYSSRFSALNYIHSFINRTCLNNTILVSPSKFIANILNSNGIRNTEIIRNLVDLPANIERGKNYPPRFLYVGRLTKDKGIETLIDIFNKNSSLELTLVGDGPLMDYVSNASKIMPNIHPVGFKENVEEYYLTHDILLLPSRAEENQPLSILEAYSYGLPVIASNIGGIPEIVEHLITGLLHQSNSRIDLENQIKYFVNNPEEANRMGQNAKRRFQEEFNPDNIVNKYIKIYERI